MSDRPRLPPPARSRWTSFIAAEGQTRRVLHEQGNPAHRLRVEHNRNTILIHLSEEDGRGWLVLAVDRATRNWAVGMARTQLGAASEAFERLYSGDDRQPG